MSASGSSVQFHQLPMFMSAREIRDSHQALDGDRKQETPAFGSGIPLHMGRRETDDELYDRKAEEATGRRAPGGDYLYEHIAKHGVMNPIILTDPTAPQWAMGSQGKPQVLGGHHRVAVMSDVRPDELMPVEHFKDMPTARKALKSNY